MEQEFFDRAVQRWQDMVFRLALHQLGSYADADDAVQEVFLRLWRQKAPFASDEHLRHWLLRVTVNWCRDQLRSPWRKRRSPRTFGLLAAAVLLVAALSATAVAEDWFGLRQAALPQEGSGSGVEENVELLSLQGWFGSPEHQAAADWQDFLNHYDDGGALDAIGNGDTGLSDRYLPYGVWTQEMAETLDTIAAKYGLALHQDSTIYDDTAAFLAVTGPFLDPALIYPGYTYPDGTFQCDGDWTAADGAARGFQLRRTVKGVFDEVFLNIGDAGAYRQWVYETADGVSLLLAERLDGGHALILADRPESFVAVNILGTEQPLSREDLEAFAEGIDFSLL